MHIEIDFIMDSPLEEVASGFPGIGLVPIFRLFGVTEKEQSVLCHLHGFLPYFYVRTPSENFLPSHFQLFQEALEV